MSAKKPPDDAAALDEARVVDYLGEHPDFFDRHPEVLERLHSPPAAGAASLAQKQIESLRDRHRGLESTFKTAVANARDNEKRSICLHRLALQLTAHEHAGADGVAQSALEVLRKELPSNVIDIVACSRAADPRLAGFVDSLFVDNKPDCGPFNPAVKAALFGRFAKRIASAVAMPLGRGGTRFGVLVFGSVSPQRFAAGMGTMFLVQCAELIAAAMTRCANGAGGR